MEANDFHWSLLLAFMSLFVLSFIPANRLINLGSEKVLLMYYFGAAFRFSLVLAFLILGARLELLAGIGLGLVCELASMLFLVQKTKLKEVLA